MSRLTVIFVLLWCSAVLSANAERVNHAGRLLGPAPVVTNSVLFNNTEADALVAAMQIFPVDSAWNADISRHSVLAHSDTSIVQPGAGFIWETWLGKLTAGQWEAANGAKSDLKSNALRPATWTSGDAAGLPMFPALPRFDECERGEIEHALRIVVKRTRAEFIYPARHYASVPYSTDPNVPAMGQRLRLKSSFAIPGNWTKQEKAVLTALRKYGALVADNGNFFSISVTPDNRWPAGCFDQLSTVGITNFEVIQTTGQNEGPRSPNPPGANAGPDRTVSPGQPVTLQATVTPIGPPPTNRWKLYSGAGTATFADSTRTHTTVSFIAPGIYTLLLSADDGVHAEAYDAVV